MNLIFDTHAHYDDEAFDADREALLASMPENGVGLIVDPGCDLDTSRRAVEIAEPISPRLRRRRLASGKLRALHAREPRHAARMGKEPEGRRHR